jgi:hypothetical protein
MGSSLTFATSQQACGICHSDSMMKEGLFPGIQYLRVSGHEIAGIIYEVGKEETIYKKRFSSDIFDTYSMKLLVFSHLFELLGYYGVFVFVVLL